MHVDKKSYVPPSGELFFIAQMESIGFGLQGDKRLAMAMDWVPGAWLNPALNLQLALAVIPWDLEPEIHQPAAKPRAL